MPQTGFLTPFWTDVIALAGVLGLFLTFLGFAFTAWQLYRQTTAATAASRATLKVADDARRQYQAHLAANARHVFGHLKQHVHEAQWELAYRRAGDLSEMLAQMPDADGKGPVAAFVVTLRTWESRLRTQEDGRLLAPKARKEWLTFSESMAAALEGRGGPLDLLPARAEQLDKDRP